MKIRRTFALRATLLGVVAAATLAGTPSPAQLYYSAPALASPPVTGTEPELALNLPGATPEELKAGLLWHLRVAMNVAALQCDFEPSFLTVSNYNATLAHHRAELARAFSTLGGYFTRMTGSAKAGTSALDQYNTKAYSSYSTVHAQRDFCTMMAKVGRDAIFAPRGALLPVAEKRLSQIRRSLVPAGEQYFTNPGYNFRATLPDFSKKCWKKDVLKPDCEAAWRSSATAAAQ